MTDRDRNTLDLTYQKLRIAPDVLVWPVREQGRVAYRIEVPQLHRFYRVGYEEYVFLSLLDGSSTIPQACGLAASKLGSRAPTAEQAKAIARWLLTNELAYLDTDQPPIRNPAWNRSGGGSSRLGRMFGRINPFWTKVPLPAGDRWINRSAQACGFLFSFRAVLIGCLLFVLAAIVLVLNWSEFTATSPDLFHPTNWIWLLATWAVLKLIHEFAHAVVCNRHSGLVSETGIVFVLFAPLAYVDVSSCWRMGSRWSRIAVASAGMYIELVVAAAAILMWQYVESTQARFLFHNLVIAAGLSTLLFNANVLMRFDGYFILADLIEVPNLYSEGSAAIRRIAQRILTGVAPPPSTLRGWRQWFVVCYGFASLVWRITICISLGIAASVMFAGAGILLSLVGIVLWIGSPVLKWWAQAIDLKRRSSGQFLRAAGVASAVVAFGGLLVVWCPLPTSVSVPAVTQYAPETVLRARTGGFICGIEVRDGAMVKKGDLLVRLENRDLSNDLSQLEIEQAQNRIRQRRATGQHDLAMLQILRENQRTVSERIDQLRHRVAGLRIVSPRDGIVVARDLDSKLGQYATEGESLLVVAGRGDKELVAMIGHDEIDQARKRIGLSVPIRTVGFQTGVGTLDRIEPRASDRLSAPALAATEGGSLPVRVAEDHDDSAPLRLLHPYFRGRIALDDATAANLPAGARSEIWIGYQTDSIYRRIHRQIGQWWRTANSRRNGSTTR